MTTTQPLLLALDQGTTSSRALVFTRAGEIVTIAQQEFAQHFPMPGWVEHDPEDIWRTQAAVAKMALARAGPVAAIGITNQRETTVLWDRASGRALGPAIVWQDRRTAAACEALHRTGEAEAIQRRTGLVVDAYFSATKLAWLLDNIPQARVRAEAGDLAFGTIDSWLIYRLTGGACHVTDVTNASRTLLFNIETCAWDPELLTLFAIPESLLPQVVASANVAPIGVTACPELPPGIPIAGLAGDQQSALFGQACHAPGMAKNTYGTGCFMLMNTGTKRPISQHRMLATIAWQLGSAPPQYALEGSVFVAGSAVQWLRDGLGIIHDASEIEALAASVSDTAGVTFVPALTGLGAPHWDPHARGLIAGLTRGTTRAHVARATLEAIAFQSVELIDAMVQDSGTPLTELRVDGGASRNNLLMQMQADFAQVRVVRPAVTETTALGAAFLAGLCAGIYADCAEIASLWRPERVFEPQQNAAAAAERLQEWAHVRQKCA
jgi:glycerol kinase